MWIFVFVSHAQSVHIILKMDTANFNVCSVNYEAIFSLHKLLVHKVKIITGAKMEQQKL